MQATAHKVPGRIKSSILRWLGVPISLTNGEFWQEFYGGESHSGEAVTPSTTLSLDTAWACTGLLSEVVSTMPLSVYKRLPAKQLAPEHYLYPIIHAQPSADMSTGTFVEIVMLSLLIWGNAFAEILRDDDGQRIIAVDFIPPDLMSIRRLKSGVIEYRWVDGSGEVRTAGEENMVHVVGRTLNGIVGVSPITYARHMMGAAIGADKAAAKMFKQGLLLAGVFETDHMVKESLRDDFQDRLKEYQGAVAAGRAPLLEGGVKYRGINMNPNDAQLLETRQFAVEQICRWYRVPPFMVGHTSTSTSWGTGIEQQKLGFLTFTLQRWLKRIEDELQRKLLSVVDRQRYFVEFNFEGLLRADSQARAQFYSIMTANAIYTRDECRAKENLPPMGGNAAVLTLQSSMVPLDSIGQTGTAAANQAKTAALNWLGLMEKDQVKEYV